MLVPLRILLAVSALGLAGGLLLSPGTCECGDETRFQVEHVKSIRCLDPVTGFGFSPLGVTFGILDELFVIDSDNSRIFILPASLTGMNVFMECPTEFADCQLIDIELNDGGGLHVSERSSGSIMVVDRWGELASQSFVDEGISGIGLGRGGRVYAAISFSGKIQIVNLDTQADAIECFLAEEGENSYPVDCLAFGKDMVMVSDAFLKKVLVLSSVGEPAGNLEGTAFERPFGLAGGFDDLVLVSDMELGLVAVFTIEGEFLGSFGGEHLVAPTFLDIRRDGVVCVADAEKMTIEVFKFAKPSTE
jgi:hypothetical protein